MKKPLVQDEFLLQKMPGKGGWTFVLLSGIVIDRKKPSLWTNVTGSIDHQPFEGLSLSKTSDGKYFFPVKAAIRKQIKKEAGDYVHLVLFEDTNAFKIPEEFLKCLTIEPEALQKFLHLKENHQKEFINWIYAAKQEETIAKRINSIIDKVLKGERLYKKIEE